MDELKRMQATPRDGYTNAATWIMAMHLLNDPLAPTSILREGCSAASLEAYMGSLLYIWTRSASQRHSAFVSTLLSDWFMDALTWIDWNTVTQLIIDPDNPSKRDKECAALIAHSLFIRHGMLLQEILEQLGATQRAEIVKNQFSTLMQAYAMDQGIWVSPTQSVSAAEPFVRWAYDAYMYGVVWEEVYAALTLEA